MSRISSLLILILVATATMQSDHVEEIGASVSGEITPMLQLVVSVDGKSFYADGLVPRTWAAASNYCELSGMKLATITSEAQYRALNSSYSSPNFNNIYWTSGRDAHQLRQFSWNSTGVALSAQSYLEYGGGDSDYRTCIFYDSRPAQSQLRSDACTAAIGTLCES